MPIAAPDVPSNAGTTVVSTKGIAFTPTWPDVISAPKYFLRFDPAAANPGRSPGNVVSPRATTHPASYLPEVPAFMLVRTSAASTFSEYKLITSCSL